MCVCVSFLIPCAQYFTLFSETLGVSVSTGYDWTSVSTETQGEMKEYSVREAGNTHTQKKNFTKKPHFYANCHR